MRTARSRWCSPSGRTATAQTARPDRPASARSRGGPIAILDVSGAPHGGRVRLLPENSSAPRISPRLLILHSIVGSADGAYRYFRDATNLESTFIVTLGGEIWQLMDTTRQADANYRANPFAVSVETEDRGDPDTEPWTKAQLDALAWLARQCNRVHRIPLRRANRWDGSGVGYHSLALSTLIPTPRGLVELGAISVGDVVFDEQGAQCQVVGVYDVNPRRCWRLRFQGAEILAGDDHLWVTYNEVERRALRRRLGADSFPEDWAAKTPRTTQQLVDTLDADGRRRNHVIPVAKPLDLPATTLPVDPYTLGLWLGDGGSHGGWISSSDDDASVVIDQVRSAGYQIETIRTRRPRTVEFGVSGLATGLRALGVLGNKHIPPAYLTAGAAQRRALLQGLMDSDGTCMRARVVFSTADERMAEDVLFLAASLGQKPSTDKLGARRRPFGDGSEFRVRFTPTIPVFRLPRKAGALRAPSRTWQNASWSLVAAEPVPVQPMRCLRVDSPNSMYLASEWCIPTHNTMFGAPGPWTPVQKTCPGRTRIRQFNDVLLPRIREGVDMAGADDILDAIAALRRDMTVFGTKGLEQTVEDFATRQRDVLAKLDVLATRMDTLEARLEALHPQPAPPPVEG